MDITNITTEEPSQTSKEPRVHRKQGQRPGLANNGNKDRLLDKSYRTAGKIITMNSDSNNYSRGSQSAQRNRKVSRIKDGNASKNKNRQRGDLFELGSNVYTYGTKNQALKYIKTTKYIAEYVGREYGRAMQMLVKDLKESRPEKPNEPRAREPTTYQVKDYEKQLNPYYDKTDKYDENKAKVIIIIKGQCSLAMKNKVESMSGYAKIEEDYDVIKLLMNLKELAFTMANAEDPFWTLQCMT